MIYRTKVNPYQCRVPSPLFSSRLWTSAHLTDCPALMKKVTYILFFTKLLLKDHSSYRTKYLPPLPILGGDILYFRRRGHNNFRAIITPFSPTGYILSKKKTTTTTDKQINKQTTKQKC